MFPAPNKHGTPHKIVPGVTRIPFPRRSLNIKPILLIHPCLSRPGFFLMSENDLQGAIRSMGSVRIIGVIFVRVLVFQSECSCFFASSFVIPVTGGMSGLFGPVTRIVEPLSLQ